MQPVSNNASRGVSNFSFSCTSVSGKYQSYLDLCSRLDVERRGRQAEVFAPPFSSTSPAPSFKRNWRGAATQGACLSKVSLGIGGARGDDCTAKTLSAGTLWPDSPAGQAQK